MEEKIKALIKEIEVTIEDLKLGIYQRYANDYALCTEDIDQEVLERLLDVDQDSEEVCSLEEFYEVPAHNWDCGEYYALKEVIEKLKNILNENN